MTNQFRVMIPVKPHIRKFLHCQYGYPVQITNKHQLGSILLTLLEKKTDCGLNKIRRESRRKRLTATVECFAKLHRAQRNGIDVTDAQIININRLLEQEFEKAIYYYVKENVGPTGRYPGYMEALRGFMEEYHINEEIDIPFDSLKKLEYRYRQKLKVNRQQAKQWIH